MQWQRKYVLPNWIWLFLPPLIQSVSLWFHVRSDTSVISPDHCACRPLNCFALKLILVIVIFAILETNASTTVKVNVFLEKSLNWDTSIHLHMLTLRCIGPPNSTTHKRPDRWHTAVTQPLESYHCRSICRCPNQKIPNVQQRLTVYACYHK